MQVFVHPGGGRGKPAKGVNVTSTPEEYTEASRASPILNGPLTRHHPKLSPDSPPIGSHCDSKTLMQYREEQRIFRQQTTGFFLILDKGNYILYNCILQHLFLFARCFWVDDSLNSVISIGCFCCFFCGLTSAAACKGV